MTRLQDFYNDLCVEMDNNYYAIAAGIDNGDIELPEYAGFSNYPDKVVLFDSEEGGENHWSAITITWEIEDYLVEKLNFSDVEQVERAVKIDRNKDVNVYETLCLYCAENDVDLNGISDEEFSSAVEIIENYGSKDAEIKEFYFWID